MIKEETRPVLWVLDSRKDLPDVTKKTVTSPLHYGDTLEIFFVRGIEGETYISGKRFDFEYENVFFIPPRHPHLSFYRKGGAKEGDFVGALHLNIEALAEFVDVKSILRADKKTLFSFPVRIHGFDRIFSLTHRILDEGRLFSARLSDLLSLFEAFSAEARVDTEAAEYRYPSCDIVDYIEEHYMEKLTVQDAAAHFGFSKYYFCKWFKTNTRVTFNEFLNAVRISRAAVDLANGYSVEETAERCGFSDPSYFVKVFKRLRGRTPRVYAIESRRK